MTTREQYMPGPANAQVRKDSEEKWTLILVRQLRHSPEKVWAALTDPAQLREWAPFDIEGSLDTPGKTVKLKWIGAPAAIDTDVKHVDPPKALEFGDIRWELDPVGGGTKLTLWSTIDRRFVAWGAAGWHISLDVLGELLDGNPIGRLAGPDAMKFAGWQRLTQEYGAQFGVAQPKW
ncbi:MAG TPA: SRPBCC domain-containing protein [Bryobacteraceae bacterium]|nr:SRPBCC domain-containing protein [Bryobacteraceae bacterium]